MDIKELEITAALANIELSGKELNVFAQAVTQMIEYFALMESYQIGSDTTGHHIRNKTNVLRDDAASESQLSDDILEQAPDLEDRFIAIPNVL